MALFQAQIGLLSIPKRSLRDVKLNFGDIDTNPNPVTQTVSEIWLFEHRVVTQFHQLMGLMG